MYEFPKASKSQPISVNYSDDDILDCLRTCYRGGIKQPGVVTNPTCAALLRKYGIEPDELIEKTCYSRGVATVKKVKRYRNPAQILGGLQSVALDRPSLRAALLEEGIIRPKTTPATPTPEEDRTTLDDEPTIADGAAQEALQEVASVPQDDLDELIEQPIDMEEVA